MLIIIGGIARRQVNRARVLELDGVEAFRASCGLDLACAHVVRPVLVWIVGVAGHHLDLAAFRVRLGGVEADTTGRRDPARARVVPPLLVRVVAPVAPTAGACIHVYLPTILVPLVRVEAEIRIDHPDRCTDCLGPFGSLCAGIGGACNAVATAGVPHRLGGTSVLRFCAVDVHTVPYCLGRHRLPSIVEPSILVRATRGSKC